MARKCPEWGTEVPPEDEEQALNRAKQHLKIFRNIQILWVDDHPENNLNERRMLRQLKAEIDIAKTTEEALSMLRNNGYDLVISDMNRNGNVPRRDQVYIT